MSGDISNGLRLTTLTEYKCQQQFAEQLPGGAQAMLSAVNKVLGKNLSMGEMKQMMKDGKLIAKDILPTLGDEMAKIARNGGALKEALLGLAVAESRVKTSFDDMLANVYRGGLSEGLKDLYQLLDNIFWEMSQGESNTGKFLKGFVDGATESIAFVQAKLNDIDLFLRFRLGMDGVDMEMLGKAAYYTSIIVALNTITGLMKWFISAPLLNGLASLAGKILGVGAATEAVAAAQVTATAAVATASSGGWISLLISQSKLLLAALTPVAAVVAAIASAAAILNLAQSKYNDFSAEQKADWQQKMTIMNASATQGYYTKSGLEQLGSQGNLPNTNPYAPMMQAAADTNRQLQEIILNAPPLRVDVRVEESELSKFIKFRVEEGMQRQIQSIIPTGTPPLIVK